jgi:hypothetical protein
MEQFDFVLKTGKSKNTTLDKAYSKLINNVITNLDEEKESRWETYNLIISEILLLENGIYFEELKYRLTDNENPNEVIIDIINKDSANESNGFLLFLKGRVEEYLEEDFFKRFY